MLKVRIDSTHLNDWEQRVDNLAASVFDLLIPCPLFQLGHVVSEGIYTLNMAHQLQLLCHQVELDLICMPRDQWHMSFLSKRLFKLPAQRK